MKNCSKNTPSDLSHIRQQIMEFTCGAHGFSVASDEFTTDGDWSAEFIVTFKRNPREERLFCRAPSGAHHVRFWVTSTVGADRWRADSQQMLDQASEFDISLTPLPGDNPDKQVYRLSTRAWIPNFSQRIFGLTFSNLMDCKAALENG